MSEDAYRYWSQVDQLVSNSGTIFDPPPAPIRSNVFNVNNPEEFVLGYFEAVSIDTVRRAFFAPDVEPPNPLDCLYAPWRRDYPPRCLDCISVPNSTFERPDYF